jgi:phosphate/sulfate permease
MALVYKGQKAVRWWEPIDDFPYRRGMGIVVLGWIIAPLMCGCAAALAFLTLRTFVLRAKNPVRIAVIVSTAPAHLPSMTLVHAALHAPFPSML